MILMLGTERFPRDGRQVAALFRMIEITHGICTSTLI